VKRIEPRNLDQQKRPVKDVKVRQSPFLKAFLETDKAWDDAAKKEWANDVERRLREVTSVIDPGPRVFGYAIQRVKNSVAIYTVTPNGQSKREIAALMRGQWPCWDKIVKAVPELMYSTVSFDACTTWEWARKWSVGGEMSRSSLEHGVFE
jgi:hypothetical protein